ncbi:MAG TPA: hypothetical protein DC049_15140, partial [Spirochaetia bacterium]|nr:hypothetical protein [Spirochaetia bacterium]
MHTAANTIIDLVSSHAQNIPDHTALVSGNIKYSYARLASVTDSLARELKLRGIKKGQIVCVMLERSAEMILSLLAIIKCGAAYLPVEPSYPKERISYLLSDSRAAGIISRSGLLGGIKVLPKVILCLDSSTDSEKPLAAKNDTLTSADLNKLSP